MLMEASDSYNQAIKEIFTVAEVEIKPVEVKVDNDYKCHKM